MYVNIIYVCICFYCIMCLILYYWSLLVCTNKEFMNSVINRVEHVCDTVNTITQFCSRTSYRYNFNVKLHLCVIAF